MELAVTINIALLWIVLLVLCVITVAVVRRLNTLQPSNTDTALSGELARLASLEKGTAAPSFSAETWTGENVTLSSYLGRKVAFVFIEPACQPCQDEIPKLELLVPRAKKAGVEITLVSLADRSKTETIMNGSSSNLPVIMPTEVTTFLQQYKIPGTPSFCFIDPQGKVIDAGLLLTNWRSLTRQWEAVSQ